jgi:hypothetical protein
MARPKKNYCDYFPHDRDMRNHRKVKAIRTKFGPIGYAIWSMTLEYLTGIDGNEFEYSDVEFELMAGDFGVSATEIRDVIDYCIKLDMLFNNNGFINSESLDERLKPVYEKRGTNKDKSKKQLRVNGKFANNKTVTDGVSATEMPQIKVKEIKVKEIKVKEINISFDSFWDLYDKKVGDKDKLKRKWESFGDSERLSIMEYIPKYKLNQPDKKFRKDPQTFFNNNSWNDELIGSVPQKQQIYRNTDFEAYKKRQQELGKTLN